MTRQCGIEDCPRPARRRCLYCWGHLRRRRIYGDFDFTQWGTADEQDVEAIIRARRPAHSLTRLERVQVAKGLTARHVSAEEIARIVGVQPRTVYRWRAEGFRQAA